MRACLTLFPYGLPASGALPPRRRIGPCIPKGKP